MTRPPIQPGAAARHRAPHPAPCPLAARCLALLLALGCIAGPARAGDGLDDLLQAIGSRPHGHATFVEHQYLKVLDRPLESRGELMFTPPDRLEKRTLAPRAESLRVADGQLVLERGKRHLEVALASYPQLAPLVEGIRATLAGDRATLDRLFTIEYSAGDTAWSLTLHPRDAELSRIVRVLRLEGQGAELRQVETVRGDGDRSVMEITPAGES